MDQGDPARPHLVREIEQLQEADMRQRASELLAQGRAGARLSHYHWTGK
jgi:hypothetical protein